MNMIKTFEFEKTDVLTLLDNDHNVWFKGFDVASILGYVNTSKAIQKHIDPEDKQSRGQIFKGVEMGGLKKGAGKSHTEMGGLKGNEKNQIFINESDLYSLILRSKLENAKAFKRWITSDVLPTLRKTGEYKIHKHNKHLDVKQIKIETEYDLQSKVVQFLRTRFPESLFTATLGENQTDSEKRLKSYCLG